VYKKQTKKPTPKNPKQFITIKENKKKNKQHDKPKSLNFQFTATLFQRLQIFRVFLEIRNIKKKKNLQYLVGWFNFFAHLIVLLLLLFFFLK
jgi:hypothetical protein